jgi:hypothetical protein
MVLLAIFLVLTILAISRAEGKWKLWNLLIILGGAVLGLGIAYLAGMWNKNMALGGEIAVPSALACGSLAAVLCPRKKKGARTEAVS